MGKPDTRRLDRAIQDVTRRLTAARQGEMWPLTASEKRQVVTALAGGSYKVLRGKSPANADRKLAGLQAAVESRLTAELSALQAERQAIVNQAAAAKAAKKSTGGWW
ncbi:hypothetical protein [Streptomyces sp. NPDC050388]|uniref:hypothetical protein n=1 Tax=Streptomyces sp. NPDC050388 TaxID=3155781 RepID=UPI00341813BA